MLNKETADHIRELDQMAKRELARVDAQKLGNHKINISALYEVIDSYEQANTQLLQSSEFRDAIEAYSNAEDSVEAAIASLQGLDYSSQDIEPILTSPVVTEGLARLEHDAVPETDDEEVSDAVDNLASKSFNEGQYHREELIGMSAVVANRLTTQALERQQSTSLSREEQAAVVLLIMLIIFHIFGLVPAITGAAASAVGFNTLLDAVEERAERLDLQ